jgi:hypothetical protein
MKKNIIILKSYPGARLANQLWNFISIYAYCLEKGYSCRNFCFFEEKKHKDKNNLITHDNYYDYFNIPLSIPVKLFLAVHLILAKICKKIRLYDRLVYFIEKTRREKILYSGEQDTFYLPPSANSSQSQFKQLAEVEPHSKIYLSGWLFRNPDGLMKYRQQIIAYFQPRKEIQKKINSFTAELKSKYKWLVGVHIRQGDYKGKFYGGKLYFNEKEVSALLKEYLKNFQKDENQTCFIICSDEAVDLNYFTGLNVIKSDFNAAEDLFLLAAADIIIGSNSTFGAFASYYGNLPFIVFEKNINWGYYQDKKYYFENKKCTTAHF